MPRYNHYQRGFTLLESLLTVAIVSTIVLIVISAVNPGRQFAQVRNTQRSSDVKTILDAVQQHALENGGLLHPLIGKNLRMVGTAASGCGVPCGSDATEAACIDLAADLVPSYVDRIPEDPTFGSAEHTYYAMKEIGSGRVQVRACGAELDKEIGVIR